MAPEFASTRYTTISFRFRGGDGSGPGTAGGISSPPVEPPVSCLEELLGKVGRDVQPELESRLRGFFGGMVRAYLPQTWVFVTEAGTASLHVDRAGTVTVSSGALPSPDVTVEIGHDRLRAALLTRRKDAVPPGELTVTPHTSKGRTAFAYLRDRLGL
jgi:hypothetical protein